VSAAGIVIHSAGAWVRLLAGPGIAYAVPEWSAVALGRMRGEPGLTVAALVVVTRVAFERVLEPDR
jgi:hypothetical protein